MSRVKLTAQPYRCGYSKRRSHSFRIFTVVDGPAGVAHASLWRLALASEPGCRVRSGRALDGDDMNRGAIGGSPLQLTFIGRVFGPPLCVSHSGNSPL